MNENETKIARYLKDAHVLEGTLRRTLIAHIAVSADGEHRRLLREHLRVTVEQEGRLADRLSRLDGSRNPALAVVGAAKEGAAIALTLVKGPADALRGPTGDDVAMRNAQDECASEALEIAVYDTLEALAEELGDTETADLARRHREQEQDFLDRLRTAMPGLARGVARDSSGSGLPLGLGGVLSAARALVNGAQTALNPTAAPAPPAPAPSKTSPGTTGTAGTVGKATTAADKLKAEPVRKPAAKPTPAPAAEAKPKPKPAAKPKAKTSSRKPGAQPIPAAKPDAKPEPVAELPAKAEAAPRADQPIAQYDDMTPYEISSLLDHLPEEKLEEVEKYERANGQREQVLDAIEKLRTTTGAG